jgi:Tfp pilus assembly protein PilZ
MSESDHNNTRQRLRVEVALQISFGAMEDMELMINADALNMSLGGMFICTNRLPEIGRRVIVNLPSPPDQPLTVQGVIRHHRAIDGEPFGVGIEFGLLTDEARRFIEELVDRVLPEIATGT